MTTQLTADVVWQEIERESFAVLGMVTVENEARTVGVNYIVANRKLYINSARDAWKVRHVAANSAVSMTLAIAKRLRFMPRTKLPPATISFRGLGRVLEAQNVSRQVIVASLGEDVAQDADRLAMVSIIEVTPIGQFVTYGIGVTLSEMSYPEIAQGRAPVS